MVYEPSSLGAAELVLPRCYLGVEGECQHAAATNLSLLFEYVLCWLACVGVGCNLDCPSLFPIKHKSPKQHYAIAAP